MLTQLRSSINKHRLLSRGSSVYQSLVQKQLACGNLVNSIITRMSSKLVIADRTVHSADSVWVEFGKLSTQYKAISLGQGFPDFSPPEYIKQALCDATTSSNVFMNQYTLSSGHPRLIQALSKMFSPLHGRTIDPMSEIIVTVGAYGALYCTIMGLINPGDEVIIIEPFFDCYEPMVRLAEGVPVFVPLRAEKTKSASTSADWKLDPAELASKFNAKTKAIIINSPHNPTGKVFTKSELEMIADLCKQHDVLVISDEVYEWITFQGEKHVRIATLPDMWERTISIGSAGKTFSVTGWKLGWCIGPANLIQGVQRIHQNCNYTCATPLQEAVAVGMETELSRMGQPESYFTQICHDLEKKRDMLAKDLREVGFIPIIPQGGYFMMADYSHLNVSFDGEDDSSATNDVKFCKWMTINKQLSAIPPSVFYHKGNKHLGANYLRFCFIKEDKTLAKAAEILKEWKETL